MNKAIGLFLMNQKGYLVLEEIINRKFAKYISFVECRRDQNIEKDYYNEIQGLCIRNKILFYSSRNKNDLIRCPNWFLAIGWRWMIRDIENLIIIHDSLLPKYRGFAPVVNALINGEKYIGVTALIAESEFDRGDIILQYKIEIIYPAKINNVIGEISKLYVRCAVEIFQQILQDKKPILYQQDESEATYSVWRDRDDYFIDWNWPADKIERFVNAVGYPYAGAKATIDGVTVTIEECKQLKNINLEIIHPGKIIFFDDCKPVVICGQGAIIISKLICDNKEIQITKLKSKFQ